MKRIEIFGNCTLILGDKPDEMIPLIEALFEGPYLELFARTKRQGWNVWGNQLDTFAE